MSIDLMAKTQIQTEDRDWEEGLPSMMDTPDLHELAAAFRQIELPDQDRDRLARPLRLLQSIIRARADDIGMPGRVLVGPPFARVGIVYQLLLEREIVSRVTRVPVPADERKFLRWIDIELGENGAKDPSIESPPSADRP